VPNGARDCVIILQPDGVRIPGYVVDFESFRSWVRSPEFPEKGRIDWIDTELEVDMSPEKLSSHGAPKAAVAGDLRTFVEGRDLGVVYVDRARVSVPGASLSAEPDVTVIFFDSVTSGRVRLVPDAAGGDTVEIEGPPDLVVEVVSQSSEKKDLRRLREAYWQAGVPEYWLVDARGEDSRFALLRRDAREYAEVVPGPDGFVASPQLGVSVRLVRLAPRAGLVRYRLETRA